MKFDEYRLSAEIKANLNKMGFKRPTDIQYKCLPAIQRGEDVLAIAQTGTGKTAAFAIPIIDKIQTVKRKSRVSAVRGLVMVPTRELALQITTVFNAISKNTKVQSVCLIGGVDQDPQIAKLVKGMDIVISTPGRMFDLISQGYLKLDRLETLILDEADHMLALGFYQDIKDVIRFLPKRRQSLFFSATINEKIKKLAYSLVRNPIRIQVSPKNPVNKNIEHAVMDVDMDDKRFFLQRLYEENESTKFLVFVRTRVRADRVQKAMERVNINARSIHGGKEQKDRDEVMAQFKSGALNLLIATDVSARGIDIPDVDYVVNYDLPEKAENYVHRIGRTGRGKKKGKALSFCSADEKEMLADIEEYITISIPKASLSKADYTETVELANDGTDNWQELMKQEEEYQKKKKKKR